MTRMTALQHLVERIRVPVQQETVSAGSIRTAYLEAGSGEPVILMSGHC